MHTYSISINTRTLELVYSYVTTTLVLVSLVKSETTRHMARNVRQHFITHLFQGPFRIDYRSIWCRDFTIICITKKLEVNYKMLAYTSFISDVHKYYSVEKIVLHHLIFYTYQD